MKRTVASSSAAASSGDIFDRSDFWWDNPRPRGRGAEATTDLESRLNPSFSSCFYDEFYFPNSFKSGRENYANTEPRFVIKTGYFICGCFLDSSIEICHKPLLWLKDDH